MGVARSYTELGLGVYKSRTLDEIPGTSFKRVAHLWRSTARNNMFQNLIKLAPTAAHGIRMEAKRRCRGCLRSKKTIWTKCFVREEKKIETGCGCCLVDGRGW